MIRLLLLSLALFQFAQCYTSTTYYLLKDFQAGTYNFWSNFDWFTGADPTHGFVQYQSYSQAAGLGMAWWKNGVSYFGADKYSKAPAGRKSVRMESKAMFTEVLIIADMTHLPGGVCGIWPAFWTANLTQWPNGGEIDMLEGVNLQWFNHYALHTTPTCVQSGQWQSGKIETSNCDNNAAGQFSGQGCGGNAANSFGTYGFNWNQQGGGVYAVDWRKEGIRIWAFPRKSIPADILSGNPTTNGWGQPMADLPSTGCNIPAHFYNHKIIFDITFCGDWAGAVYPSSGCPGTCTDQVANNPSYYQYSYFGVQSLKVYKSTKPV